MSGDYQMALLLQRQINADQQSLAKQDHQMALVLQEQFAHEEKIEKPANNLVYASQKTANKTDSTKSLVDPSWELIDPTPNVHNLFLVFNEKFFWNKLLAVCVSWSKRMTSCAGVCCYQGRGGLCSITLSEPLLKLRPRKDLVETLLHEMIHAFLFVTNNNRDRDGHGPEFHKHMYRINNEAGTNITVYHDFHDEVKLYLTHWWKCDGPCRLRKPYFGLVRRSMNRAPGPRDRWWGEHHRNCGGTFIKVREPEKPTKSKTGKETKSTANSKNDIRKFLPAISPQSGNNSSKSGDIFKKPAAPKPLSDNTNIKNIHGFHDIDKTPKGYGGKTSMNAGTIVVTKKPSTITKPKESAPVDIFSGSGHVLSSTSASTSTHSTVRDHWANKFNASNISKKRLSDEINRTPKRPKLIEYKCPICKKTFSRTDWEIHKTKCEPKKACFLCDKEVPEQLFDKHLQDCMASEEFFSDDFKLPCDVCNELVNSMELKVHQERCLQNLSISIETEPALHKHCTFCNSKVNESIYEIHMESCLLKKMDDIESKMNPAEYVECLVCKRQVIKSQLNCHLNDCMSDNIFKSQSNDDVVELSDDEVHSFINDNSLMEEYEKQIAVDVTSADSDVDKCNCPNCNVSVLTSEINAHLDMCLQ